MHIHVARETAQRERRVALVPETVEALVGRDIDVSVEAAAGTAAGFADSEYAEAGAGVIDATPDEVDLLLCVRAPGEDQLARLRRGASLIALLDPLGEPERARRLADAGLTAYALELVPRVTRAQSMDVLSSQANLAGYVAVLEAAVRLPRIFPMMMTAAGTIPPAKALVLGAGVAGLQAIATARRLGAVVRGFDIRPEVKEQVESLGARYVGLVLEEASAGGGYAKEVSEDVHRREQQLLADECAKSDVVVTTAAIPGRRAPVLVTRDVVESMRPGSVVVDLAAASGGNCELTMAGEEVEHAGVRILGLDDAPSRVAAHASRMFSRNVAALLELLTSDGELAPDPEDEIVAATTITRDGAVVHERVRSLLESSGQDIAG